MTDLLTSEGSLALAMAVLVIVLGYRFSLPERGRDLGGFLTYAVTIGLTFVAARGLLPAFPPLPSPLWTRLGGAGLLIAGLIVAGASSKARLLAGRGQIATSGPYLRIRHPLYLGLSLVLLGTLLRNASALGAITSALAIAHYVALGHLEERESARAFGATWTEYASRTRAVLPIPRGSRRTA